MIILNDKQADLLEIVKQAHEGQLRKYIGTPYWTHCLSVADIVHKYCPAQRMGVEIALCHDLLEDTEIKEDQLANILLGIGYELSDARIVERGVIALTDVYTYERFDHMKRAERKAHEATRLHKIHADFQNIKYADLIHNTMSIVEHDKKFAETYLKEKEAILNGMRGGNLDLFVECYKTLRSAQKELELKTF